MENHYGKFIFRKWWVHGLSFIPCQCLCVVIWNKIRFHLQNFWRWKTMNEKEAKNVLYKICKMLFLQLFLPTNEPVWIKWSRNIFATLPKKLFYKSLSKLKRKLKIALLVMYVSVTNSFTLIPSIPWILLFHQLCQTENLP